MIIGLGNDLCEIARVHPAIAVSATSFNWHFGAAVNADGRIIYSTIISDSKKAYRGTGTDRRSCAPSVNKVRALCAVASGSPRFLSQVWT